MSVSLLLAAAAVGVRWIGAGALRAKHGSVRWLGLPLLPAATWLAAGAVGIFAPAWMAAAAVPLVLAVAAAPGDDRWILGVDATLVAVAGLASMPSLSIGASLLAAAGTAAVWLGVDALARVSGGVGRAVAVAGAALAALAAVEFVDRAGDQGLYSLREAAPGLAVVPSCEGDRVELESGTVGWLDRPRGSAPHPTALFLHGAEPRGGRQPVACAVRRVLLGRGYAVLALDHPGYGASAAPDSGANLERWDPASRATSALAWIRGEPDLDAALVVGHSMGAVDAVRMTADGLDGVSAMVLIGAALSEEDPDEDYWYGRFHRDRSLSHRLTRERWREIEDRFYSARRALGEMPPDHPPVVFAEAEREWEHLLEPRDEFYRRIPGEKQRALLDGASHYLNSFRIRDVLVTDVDALRRLSAVLPAPP